MHLKRFLLIFVVVVKCENGRRRDERRQGKLFSFNTMDDDISVDLDFNIPFIRIPVKRSSDSAYGLSELPTININPASLALGGAVVLGASVLLPFFLKNYALHGGDRYSRFLQNTEFGSEGVIDFAQNLLADSQSLRGCPLRVACWTVQRNLADPQMVLKQIVNNRLLSVMVNSSAVEDAMASGRHGRDCMSYGPCPFTKNHLPMLIDKLTVLNLPHG